MHFVIFEKNIALFPWIQTLAHSIGELNTFVQTPSRDRYRPEDISPSLSLALSPPIMIAFEKTVSSLILSSITPVCVCFVYIIYIHMIVNKKRLCLPIDRMD